MIVKKNGFTASIVKIEKPPKWKMKIFLNQPSKLAEKISTLYRVWCTVYTDSIKEIENSLLLCNAIEMCL